METAREIVKKEKESKNALPYLMRVAKQEVAATEKELVEARFMLADSWHYYWFAPLKGYRAYKEILAAHGDDPGVVARCRVEMAACLLEMARMPNADWKASFEDVRRECQRILEEVPAEYDRARATADLIYCETFYFDGQNERALREFDGFEGRHPGRPRETSMVREFRGRILAELGRWTEARESLLRNVRERIADPDEWFYWKGDIWDMQDRAIDWIAFYSRNYGDANTLIECERFRNSVPLGPVASSVDRAFPHAFYAKQRRR